MTARGRWTALGAALLVAAGLLEWLEPDAVLPPFSEIVELPGGIATVAPAATQASATAPEPEGAPAATATGPSADQVQLCGGDWVEIDANGWIDDDAFARVDRVRSGRERVLAALRASADPYRQTVADWLDPPGRVVAPPAVPPDTPCDAACLGSILASTIARHEPLARRAAASTDPRSYALAFRSCRWGALRGAGACTLLSADQWARLDPGNALPWVYALEEALLRGDVGARDEALHRIATSPRFEEHPLAIAGMIAGMAGSDESLLATVAVVTEAATGEAAAGTPWAELLVTCRAARTDVNLNQVCLRMAETMVASADTVIARMIGIAIGLDGGWPVERVDRLRGELRGMGFAPTGSGNVREWRDPRSASCPDLRQDLDRVRAVAASGEVAVAQRALRRSNVSLDALTREARAARELDEARRAGR